MAAKTEKKSKKAGKEKKKKYSCDGCPAICCHDLALPITKPRTKHDVTELSWQLHYDTVHVCIRSRRWFLVVKGRCIYLDDQNRCTIYDRRPQRCRDHPMSDCEKHGPWYDSIIHTPEELQKYLKKS